MNQISSKFYSYFPNYTQEQVMKAMEFLSEEDKQIVYKRYGRNLEEFHKDTLTKKEYSRFYNVIRKKITIALEQPEKKKGRTIYDYYKEENPKYIDYAISLLTEEDKNILELRYQKNASVENITKIRNDFYRKVIRHLNRLLEEIKTGVIKVPDNLEGEGKVLVPSRNQLDTFSAMPIDSLEKEDYQALRDYLKRTEFQEALKTLPLEECIVASLSLIPVGQKTISIHEISSLLGISKEEVMDMMKKGLIAIKNQFDTIVDEEANQKMKWIGELTNEK